MVCTFPVGIWYTIKRINDERVFVILYAISAVYFAGVMVRLMLTLTPVVCILSGVAFSGLLDVFLREDNLPEKLQKEEVDEQPTEKKQLYDRVRIALFYRIYNCTGAACSIILCNGSTTFHEHEEK